MNKKLVFLPYDMDTAIGINNEGALVFGYSLEDTDHIGNAEVFNGQSSVLWTNLREMFGPEIKAMYQNLRAGNKFNYAYVEQVFEEHQSKWPEAVFNEDAFFKYIQPLINDGDETYLTMLLGSKAEQRKWWLYNRFRYLDSKYNTGDSLSDRILIRGNARSNMNVTPYADIYVSIRWASTLKQVRATRNVATLMVNPLDSLGDTDIYVYSAGQLADLGDLSGLMVSFADFHSGIKLQNITLGSPDQNYENAQLRSLSVGNLTLLKKIDVRNCSSLGTSNENYPAQKNIDLSGCAGIEEVYFDGTNIGSVSLPNGGFLKKLHLPGTITNLTIRNQTSITEFVCPDFSHVTTLFLENTNSIIDIGSIVDDVAEGCRVRIFNYRWDFSNIAAVHTFLDKFDGMTGMDQNGDNVSTPQIYATVHVPSATGDEIDSVTARYPDITVDADVATFYLRYYNEDGTELLYTETVQKNQNGTWATQPTKTADAQYTYAFAGWSLIRDDTANDANALTNLTNNRNVYAAYTRTIRTYTVTFVKAAIDGGGTLLTLNNVPYGTTPAYTGATPTSTNNDGGIYTFEGWTPEIGPITGNTTYTAKFHDSSVTVTFMDGNTILGIAHVASGGNATWSGSNPTKTSTAQYNYTFAGWSAEDDGTVDSGVLNNITESKIVYAVFTQSVRTYAITFVRAAEDGGGTLQTVNVAYGSTPSYSGNTPTTTKEGEYRFTGWTPAIVAVTGAATYTAVFVENTSKTRGLIDRTIRIADNSEALTIRASAFAYCRSLATVSFPSVTSIGSYAFAYCTNLTTISFPLATSIGNSAFYSCSHLTTISFPLATSIGNNAFQNCYSLTTVSFPSVTSIGDNAFLYCSKLATVSFSLVTSIGNSAFLYCANLTTVSFPLATSIGNYAFQNCTSLTTVSFPSVTSIGSYAFQNCSRLATVSFPSVTSIGNNAFQNCYSLATVSFPSVTSIGNSAFYGCYSLTTVYFPSVTYIGINAFAYCTSLTTFAMESIQSVPTLNNSNAFTSASSVIFYAPDSLVTAFQAATNWSYFSSRIKGISELPD